MFKKVYLFYLCLRSQKGKTIEEFLMPKIQMVDIALSHSVEIDENSVKLHGLSGFTIIQFAVTIYKYPKTYIPVRIASTGSKRDAINAGIIPDTSPIPTDTETPKAIFCALRIKVKSSTTPEST